MREAGSMFFVFRFKMLVESTRVLLHQPWTFNKSLFVLCEFKGLDDIDGIFFNSCLH